MTTRQPVLLALCSLALASCRLGGVGPRVEEFGPGQTGRGAVVRALVDPSTTLEGELIAADDSAMLLLTAGESPRVVNVPWTIVRHARFDGIGTTAESRRPPSRERLERIRLVARHSAGLSDEQLAALLAAYGQTAPDIPGRPSSTLTPDAPHAAHAVAPHASTSPDDIDAFLRTARAVSQRFDAIEFAIEAGYRRVGPDFPGMGEHWVQPGLLVAGRFDPERPPILNYIRVDGRPVLVGVAYAVPLQAGGRPPSFPDAAAWHDHTGTIDEESFLVGPAHMHTDATAAEGGARLAMLHVWIRAENPDGVFAQHNWALPYFRLGIAPPARPEHAAARAVSLAAGGDAFYHALLERALRREHGLEPDLRAAIDDARADVDEILAARTQPDEARLAAVWSELVDTLGARAPAHRAVLEELLR